MTDEHTLPDARRQLDDAHHHLCAAQTHHDAHGTYTAPSLLTQLQQALQNADRPRNPGGRPGFESHPTAWLSGIDKMQEIERKVKEWAAVIGHDGRDNIHTLLDRVNSFKWAPAQIETVHEATRAINHWADWIHSALTGDTVGLYDKPCPNCSQGPWTYRRIAGENVKVTILVAHRQEDVWTRVECIDCHHQWVGITQIINLGRIFETEAAA
ncbi:DUF7341 domain-containing protein [Tsukamurella sp. USMM236]|uniref:DUF7341 domain-containing protein n=1 Tax=Tsukamurella sp. USMM236 TaxID=3081301 RepID=UPI0030180FD6